MVTNLSSTGLDLSRDDFLEFWVFQPVGSPADSAGVRLVLDLGTVSEDALAIAPDSLAANGADTVFSGRQYVGTGRLDTERTEIGIFNANVDDIGILGDRPDQIAEAGQPPVESLALCDRVLTNAVLLFPWGDLSSRCTRGNGVLDTEDLNGDAVLDAAGPNENVFRYVVNLANNDFFVRNGVTSTDTQGRTAVWKLYRIPIRQPTATLNTPTLRLAQHLRITLATPPDNGDPDIVARLAVARMRFVGSPWVRRADTPIAGFAGAIGLPHGAISTSVVSTENRIDLGYESPPGVTDNVSRQGGDRETAGTQINEKSLRIIGSELGLNERAEAYLRFPAGPQNLLTYRQLKVWFRGRGPGWEEGDLQAFIKLGSDDENFYLYRAPAKTTTWEPEAVIDLETWRRLRADVENRWLAGAPPSGAAECGIDAPDAYVACEGPYLVQVRDPAINPPNLAAVQEVSAGIYRVALNVTVPDVRALGGRHPAQPARVADRAGGIGGCAPDRVRHRQHRGVVHQAEWPVPADQSGSDVPRERRLPARQQRPARSLPAGVVRARDPAHRHLRAHRDQPRAAQWHRSPWRVAAGTQAAGIVECHLLTLAPADRARHQLDHPRISRSAVDCRQPDPGTESDRSVERRGERLRLECLLSPADEATGHSCCRSRGL